MVPPLDPGLCPDCGGKLLYNGVGLVCIRCPFAVAKPPSEKKISAVQPFDRERQVEEE